MRRILTIAAALLGLSACNEAQQKQSAATRKMTAEADVQVGMPSIKNWRERRMMRMLFEMRDAELTTFSYVKNLDGKLSFVCQSIGFGLPYAAQYTSPTDYVHNKPQPEPNGLYMPDQAEATWIMCVDSADKRVKPVYVEERLIVSPFTMRAEGPSYAP